MHMAYVFSGATRIEKNTIIKLSALTRRSREPISTLPRELTVDPLSQLLKIVVDGFLRTMGQWDRAEMGVSSVYI